MMARGAAWWVYGHTTCEPEMGVEKLGMGCSLDHAVREVSGYEALIAERERSLRDGSPSTSKNTLAICLSSDLLLKRGCN